MLTVKELRTLAASLPREEFRGQLGPFVLVQRPPESRMGANKTAKLWEIPAGTMMARPEIIAQGILTLLFQFDDLIIANLPPMKGVVDLTVGRLPDCDLIIDDPSVSKRHAVLLWEEGGRSCLVKDLGSTNGTYLNDAKIRREVTLRDGDIVSFGEVQFWYLLTDTLHDKLARSGVGKRVK